MFFTAVLHTMFHAYTGSSEKGSGAEDEREGERDSRIANDRKSP